MMQDVMHTMLITEVRAHIDAGRHQAAIASLSRAVTLAADAADEAALKQCLSLTEEIVRREPSTATRLQVIDSQARGRLGYLRSLRSTPPPPPQKALPPEPDESDPDQEHIEELLKSAEAELSTDPELGVLLLRDEADAAVARHDLPTLELLAEAAQRWVRDGHERVAPTATDLHRAVERLRWRLRRARLLSAPDQTSSVPQVPETIEPRAPEARSTSTEPVTTRPDDYAYASLGRSDRVESLTTTGKSRASTASTVDRGGFWKPWKLAVASLLLLFSYIGMLNAAEQGRDPNSLQPIVGLLWIVLLVWAIVWAIVRRASK